MIIYTDIVLTNLQTKDEQWHMQFPAVFQGG